MFIHVCAVNQGFPGRHRAGRHFENGKTYVMEVVDDGAPSDPVDPKTGKPSMERISAAGYEAIKGDNRIKSWQDGDLNSDEATTALATVRAELVDTQGKLTAANIRIAALEQQLAAKGDGPKAKEPETKGEGKAAGKGDGPKAKD